MKCWLCVASALLLSGLCRAATGAPGYAVDVRILDRSAQPPQPYQARATLNRQSVKVDLSALAGQPTDILYHADTESLYLVEHARKTYSELDAANLNAVGEGMRSVEAFVRDQLGQTPDAGDEARGPVTVQKADGVRTIGGLPCQGWVVRNGSAIVQRLWTASWEQMHLDRREFRAAHQLAHNLQHTARALGRLFGVSADPPPTEAMFGLDGYPVLLIQYDGGNPAYEIHLGKPRPADVQPAQFEVPGGYRRGLPGIY